MTAARRPSRAAATATFVGLPPSDFANVRTSGSGTPICSGYRSTPTLPIVTTSRLGVLPGVLSASCDPRRRSLLWCAVQHDVLLEHVPPAVARGMQVREDVRDTCDAFAERHVETLSHRV